MPRLISNTFDACFLFHPTSVEHANDVRALASRNDDSRSGAGSGDRPWREEVDVGRANGRARGRERRAGDRALELSDVPRPVIGTEQIERRGSNSLLSTGKPFDAQYRASRRWASNRDIRAPFMEGRQADRERR